jgi:hypothetical protein
MKSLETDQEGEGRRRENDGGVNLRYIISTYVNIQYILLYISYMLIIKRRPTTKRKLGFFLNTSYQRLKTLIIDTKMQSN